MCQDEKEDESSREARGSNPGCGSRSKTPSRLARSHAGELALHLTAMQSAGEASRVGRSALTGAVALHLLLVWVNQKNR